MAGSQQWPEVVALARQITGQVPGSTPAWDLWFQACHRMGDFAELEAAAVSCLQHKPRYVPALIARGTALRMLQRHDEALQCIEKAARLETGNAAVLNHLGVVYKELGQAENALEVFNRCIAIKPDYTAAYWNRSDLLTDPQPEQIKEMSGRVQKPSLSLSQKARLHYALARAYEFIGDNASQFHHVAQGAQCKRETVDYDHAAEMQQMRAIPEYFSGEVLGQQTIVKSPSSVPVFICGLPRSGTTLLEQILSSHPEVVAGGEINALPLATAQCLRAARVDKPFPEWAKDLKPADWEMIGRQYYHHTRHLQGGARFTDKNLQNYKAIGLIHLALPEAKIIYCRRDPMDNLWGCYRQLFGEGQHYTYNQTELAQTWKAAESALRHWKQYLGDQIFLLDYEDLIADQQGTTEKLLAFVGLGWDAACLNFHENPRAVATISSVQVRKPLSGARVGQWKKYQTWLEEMQAALE
ncbi:MAG: sulfotransferase [Ketobacteraceae bacterium]|nr:sulfotransferase [Ketobacteraceae bacterium]